MSKSHKKKRKRKSHVETGNSSDEGYKCNATLSDAADELKQLKLSDGSTAKSSSKPRKKRKGSAYLEAAMTISNDRRSSADDAGVKEEIDFVKQTKRRKRNKQKCFDNLVETLSIDDLHLESSGEIGQDHHDKHTHGSSIGEADVSQEMAPNVQAKVLSDHTSVEDEELDESEEMATDLQETTAESVDGEVIGGDDVMPLMPLGHERKSTSVSKEKKTVQRHLPQWITDADVIPDDIIEQSR